MNRPLLLGVEIGGTKLQVGAGSASGTIDAHARDRIEPAAGAARILEQIETLSLRLCRQLGREPEDVAGVGIGFGGPVDPLGGVTLKSHQVPGWDGFPLAAWCRERFPNARVRIENDADTAGLAEATSGAGVGRSPLLYVTVGSGIGGGLLLDGTIQRGAGSGAAEIGHLWHHRPGLDGLGGLTVEQVASGWSIERRARSAVASGRDVLSPFGAPGTSINAADVARAAALGNPEATAILAEAVEALAGGLAHAATLIGPRRIILGGGVSLIDEALWLDPIRHRLEQLAFPPFVGTFDLVPAALGEQVVIHGALALAASGIDA